MSIIGKSVLIDGVVSKQQIRNVLYIEELQPYARRFVLIVCQLMYLCNVMRIAIRLPHFKGTGTGVVVTV